MPTFTTDDGTDLFYRCTGDPAGGTTLFVHPFMHNSTIWLDQLKAFRPHRRVIALDLRGHGRSDPNPNPKIVDKEHLADLVAFLDSIEGTVDLVGMAFGGNMCALLYEQRPERVRSITMISSNFLPGEQTAEGRRYTGELARIAALEDKGIVYRRWLEYIMSPQATLFARARYRSILEVTPVETMVAFLGGYVIEPRPDLPAKLKVPVLVPVGSDDTVIELDGALAQVPNLEIVTLEGSGRLLPIEAPEALNEALSRFWSSLD